MHVAFKKGDHQKPLLSPIRLPNGKSVLNAAMVTEVAAVDEALTLEVGALVEGKPFDAMAAGTFRPGNLFGTQITWAEEDMPAFLENTLRAIEATRDENGDIVGLPIDSWGHEHGSGASGWIVDVFLDAENPNIVRAVPKWTAHGIEALDGGKFRWFSGEFDMLEKVMLGGSLTNWPATRLDSGEILLRPILLSQDLMKFELPEDGESLEDQARRIRDAFYLMAGPTDWVMEVFDDHLIVESDGQLFSVPYESTEEGTLLFTERGSWTEVDQIYVEAQGRKLFRMPEAFASFLALFSAGAAEDEPVADESGEGADAADDSAHQSDEGDIPMGNIDFSSLSPEEQAALQAQALERAIPRLPDESDEVYTARVAVLANFQGSLGGQDVEALEAAYKVALDAEVAKLTANQTRLVREATERIQLETNMTKLSMELVGGTGKFALGLPVEPDRLKDLFMKVSAEVRDEFVAILSSVVETGLVTYTEIGDEGERQAQLPFPAKMEAALKSWVAADHPVEEFFEQNKDVLEPKERYDLAPLGISEEAK